jgi:hypothetical protein
MVNIGNGTRLTDGKTGLSQPYRAELACSAILSRIDIAQ